MREELIKLSKLDITGTDLWNVLASLRGPDLQTTEDEAFKKEFTEPIRGYFFPQTAKAGGAYFMAEQDKMSNLKFWQDLLDRSYKIRSDLSQATSISVAVQGARTHYIDHIKSTLRIIVEQVIMSGNRTA